MKSPKHILSGLRRHVNLRTRDLNLILALALIVLVNVVGQRAYLRFDLTERNVYSLSPVSREVASTLNSPMQVKVFYSSDVPATYQTVRRYLVSLLDQYEAAGARLSYEIYPMTRPSHEQEAQDYGVRPVQIREIRSDEFQQTRVHMGAAFIYGDTIETINRIASTQGLEYDLTTTMQKMVREVDALAGAEEPVGMTLYASENLADLEINGLGELSGALEEIAGRIDERSAASLEFTSERPSEPSRIEALIEQYGLRRLRWGPQDTRGEKTGVLGVVLSYRDRVEVVPVEIVRTLLGGYQVQASEGLSARIEEQLGALMGVSPTLAYVTGHGEKSLRDPRQGAGALARLLGDRYQPQPVDLSSNPIPADARTVIINGPREEFSEWELYQLDQFLMRGGSLLVLADPFEQQRSRGMPQATYDPVNTGLGNLLSSYGIELGENYVLDENSFVSRRQGGQDVQVYNAPQLSDSSLSDESVVTDYLQQVLFLNTSTVSTGGSAGSDSIRYLPLAQSSERSWVMRENIRLNPMLLQPPQSEEKFSRRTLALLAEGSFSSHFDGAAEPPEGWGQDGGNSAEGGQEATGALGSRSFLRSAVSPGRIIVAGTSEIAGPQLLAQPQQGGRTTPNAIFVQNIVDYLAGRPNVPPMRSKGLQENRLEETSAATRSFIRLAHVVFVPFIVVVGGLLAWGGRRRYQQRIQNLIQGEASR